jgi:hypothetical protein
MKSLRLILLAALLGTIASSNCAWADRGHGGGGGHFSGHDHGHFRRHVGVGVFIAAPLFYPWSYGADPYYSPPTVFVEQGDSSRYWYYCSSPPGYYPNVKNCRVAWTSIVPAPLRY